MTAPMMALAALAALAELTALAEKGLDADMLHQMVRFMARQRMDIDVQ